ncbi:hypothetical protein EV361DRAFT_944955 [Lentinula raphanica]|nr:hypothetical protein EV361DRAFT_944955 [Lentinula raphanica]
MSGALPAPLPAKCNMCRKIADKGYKSCSDCRKKQNAYRKQKKDRIKLGGATFMFDEKTTVEHNPSSSSSGLKRKAVEELDDTLERMKKRLQKKRVDASSEDRMAFGTEFQTAEEMHHEVKGLVRKNTRLNYKACYSVVADPDCNVAKRAKQVTRDIRKISRVPFNHKATIATPTQSSSLHALKFRCTCTSEQKPVDKHNAAAGSASTPDCTSCQGEVEITVMNDSRHPSGIAGQQIRIHIHH